jgi:anti-sigma-K factor RskA
MSDYPDNTGPEPKRDDPMIAAEYALGLLEGEELMSARGKAGSDADFAWRKEWWDNWFAPLTDDIDGMEPSSDVWARIYEEVNGVGKTGGAEVIDLTSRLRRWQWTAGITSAAAAVLMAVMVFAPGSEPVTAPGTTQTPQLAAADPLVAQVPIGDTGLRLDVTYIPDSEKMLVAAIGLTADGVHDHELWLVPADGSELQSLGVVAPGEVRSMELPANVARNLENGVQIVLTREPIGGKPEGVDAGPVVAQGAFSQV